MPTRRAATNTVIDVSDRYASLLPSRKKASDKATWTSEPRGPLIISGGCSAVLDILAVDVVSAGLAVIGLRESRSASARQEAREYARLLEQQQSVFLPFFSEPDVAMAWLYGCEDFPASIASAPVAAFAAWPVAAVGDRIEPVKC
jgi:hypothetical protein